MKKEFDRPRPALKEILGHFRLEGIFLDCRPVKSGHINETYASRFKTRGGVIRYIHQRINRDVFKEPEKLMENIDRVTRHCREQIVAAGGDPTRETLNLIPTVDGACFYKSPGGETWRSYAFIRGAKTHDRADRPDLAYWASQAFGRFQKMLDSLPGKRLHETIPGFHHTPKRFRDFLGALEKDPKNRSRLAKKEIAFVLKREKEISVLTDLLGRKEIPERVTHNDTKLNNVMIDNRTGRSVCVIDLDTVMPGSALYDFGDSVRLGASTAEEDERVLSKVELSLDLFESLVRGYLDAASDFLTLKEVELLPFSAKLMTFECGMRFLTDYLNGDSYFRIHRQDHNLDRCRTQFKMVESMERRLDRMTAVVKRSR